jgi:uncharacterized protein YndB with AHSA1/START domain
MRITTDIDATPEEVYDLYVDPQRRSEWNPAARSVTLESGGTNETGSRYIVDTRYGRMVVDVLEVDRPRLYRLRERSGSTASDSTITFEPLPDGRCRLVADVAFEREGRFGRLLTPIVAAGGRWWAGRELRRLKAAAERQSVTTDHSR